MVSLQAGKEVNDINGRLSETKVGARLVKAVNHTLKSFELLSKRTSENSKISSTAEWS
jgi:hypothetical protein